MEIYEEPYFEVHDPDNATVVAHFFDKRYADFFVSALHAARAMGSVLK